MAQNTVSSYSDREKLSPPPTLLVVDDDPDILRVVEFVLSRQDYKVLTATNGKEALKIFSKHRDEIELVLSDVVMPEMGGIELLENMRKEKPQLHHLPFILISAENMPAKKVEGLDKGADDYITKPFSMDELEKKVKNHIRGFRLHRALLQAHEDSERKTAILERDLVAARAVQRGLLPVKFPNHPQVQFSVIYEPAERLGGDFYDVVDLGEGRMGILIGDVSGHGVSAAFVTIMAKMAMQITPWKTSGPAEAIAEMNNGLLRMLQHDGLRDAFVTALFSTLDLGAMEISTASGGHPPLLIHRRATGEMITVAPQATFLGAFDSVDYQTTSTPLQSGDRLLYYTDGLFESQRPDGQDFTMARVLESLRGSADEDIEACLRHMMDKLKAFMAGRGFDDDITLVGVDIS